MLAHVQTRLFTHTHIIELHQLLCVACDDPNKTHTLTANLAVDVDFEEFAGVPREQKPFMLCLPDLDGIAGNGMARCVCVCDNSQLICLLASHSQTTVI